LTETMQEQAGCRPILSAPALAAALREVGQRSSHIPAGTLLGGRQLAPMYHVGGATVEEEAARAAHVLVETAERLRRLGSAYGEWQLFDAGAYFDLRPPQLARLVKISERVSTVHVLFFGDLLLPSFRAAESYYANSYLPAYQRYFLAQGGVKPGELEFYRKIQPQMVARWGRLNAVIQAARRLLEDQTGYWAANGAEDERAYWRKAWEHSPAPGLPTALKPSLAAVATLTLAFDFPLPAARQPGRLRRLRRNRARHNRWHHRGPSTPPAGVR
jgi:hypothetical protein